MLIFFAGIGQPRRGALKPTRRQILSHVPMVTSLSLAPGAPAGSRPNIVFIMADDLGYADLSCYGRRDFTTPNLDRMATEGLKFTNFYANAPVCSPTRVALMTGRYQYRLPVGLEEPLENPERDRGLPPEHPTLPSMLREVGYRT